MFGFELVHNSSHILIVMWTWWRGCRENEMPLRFVWWHGEY